MQELNLVSNSAGHSVPAASELTRSSTPAGNDVPARWLRLGLAIVAVVLVWLVVLPSLGQNPAVRSMIDRNEAAGIDAGAVFYSEHPNARIWQREVESKVLGGGHAFWGH